MPAANSGNVASYQEAQAPNQDVPVAYQDSEYPVQLQPKRKRRRGVIAAIIACCIVVAGVAGAFFIMNPFEKPADEPLVKPETAVVSRENFSSFVHVPGTVGPAAEIYVTPEVSGTVREVKVREGQNVQAGDILFVMKNSDLEDKLSDAESALEKAKEKVSDEQSKVTDAQTEYDDAVDEYNAAVEKMNSAQEKARTEADQAYDKTYSAALDAIPDDADEKERAKLEEKAVESAQKAFDKAYDAAIGNVDDPGDFNHDPYVSAVDSAQSDLDSAEEKQQKAQEEYDHAKEALDKLTVKAPATGTLLALNVKPGSAVSGSSGESTSSGGESARIGDLSMLTIEVGVGELDLSAIRMGQLAKTTFPAVKGLETDAKVVKIDTVAMEAPVESAPSDASGPTFKVTLLIEKPDNRLKPGMSADAKIMTGNIPNVFVIPLGAVKEDADGAFVYVVTDEDTMATERRKIVVAGRSDSQVAVKSGLERDEVVVVDPSVSAQ